MSGHMLKDEVREAIRVRLEPLKSTPGRALETGTGWGESAKFLGELLPKWTIYTVDGFGLYGDGRIYDSWDHRKIKEVNKSLPSNVIQILGDSQRIPWELPLDFLYIDADHSYNGCYADFLRYSPYVKSDSFICFDDYNQPNNPSNGVKEVVKRILKKYNYFTLEYEGHYCAIIKKLL